MIELVEDRFIAETRAALGAQLRVVDSLPGALTGELLRQIATSAPAVYFAFLGGAPERMTGQVNMIARWGAYVLTDHLSGHRARLRGDGRQIGVYEILTVLVPRLHGFDIPECGRALVTRVENMFTVQLDRRGVAVHAISLEIPLPMARPLDPALLAPFETFHAEHVLAADAPVATDTVELPQE